MIDERARFGEAKPGIQTETAKELYNKLKEEVLTAPKRVQRRGALPCAFGKGGTCCRVCNMGPCQVVEGVEELRGVCGASAATVVARNFARMVAAGTSAHSDHGRHVAKAFYEAVHGEVPFDVRDKRKLRVIALALGVDPNLEEGELLRAIADAALRAFSQQEGELVLTHRAPKPLLEKWRKYGVVPRGVDREVVELIHRTTIGVDQEYKNILMGAAKCSLADGWGGSMIATELQDLLLGNPQPIRAKVNIGLGVIKKDYVNVAVHGHDPILADALVQASYDPEVIEEAKKVGAKGVNLSGVCCTGNEVLMRKAIPIAGSFIQQEVVIATGALEAMIVDVQCIMQNVVEMAKHFHTAVITTSPIARMEGALHIPFDEKKALEVAKEILKTAIARFPLRDPEKINIPEKSVDIVAGFSHEAIMYILGGRFRASYKPLNENVINGKILGIAAIVGCDNYRVSEPIQAELAKELIANNVLVLATGCSATQLAMEGLLSPEALELAGPGLREVLEAVGCPPVLHMGSCVDNSRLLIAATEIVHTGGLGEDIYQIPAVGCAPQWMSEKAVAIGMYFVTSGVQVVFGPDFPTLGSKTVTDFLFYEIEKYFGGSWRVARTANEFANIMIDRINFGRKNLGIDKPKPRVLFDMAMRRALEGTRQVPIFHGLGCFGAHPKIETEKTT
ncbi:MAG: anaerobic carbon-monoxide dehydrogenase catalytic subunit [Thermodesulfobacteriaceae bacterium]|nr:anaerobic carbon-monoxide dehydrogenase catalytic subunit [Thermodesulfobacteriaceae bacterium]